MKTSISSETPSSDEMSAIELPGEIATILQDSSDPDIAFTALMPALVEVLQCDRCFLFIRDPQRQRTRITHGYSREPRWPTMVQADWSRESPDLNAKDPLTLSAYQSPEAHFIEDIETAPAGMLDVNLERSVFGHRALIHAPIYADAEFYGVLEPCVFETPRVWSEGDRRLIQNLQQVLGAWVIRYLQSVS
ncbi:MAG: GAF domain-containing protein [Elainellaceae cyanobacterium]